MSFIPEIEDNQGSISTFSTYILSLFNNYREDALRELIQKSLDNACPLAVELSVPGPGPTPPPLMFSTSASHPIYISVSHLKYNEMGKADVYPYCLFFLKPGYWEFSFNHSRIYKKSDLSGNIDCFHNKHTKTKFDASSFFLYWIDYLKSSGFEKASLKKSNFVINNYSI